MEKQDLYEKVQAFTREVVEPKAERIDKENKFPADIFKQIGELGLFALIIPAEAGGLGMGLTEAAEVSRLLATGAGTVGLCYMMHNAGLTYVLQYGQPALREKIITDILTHKNFFALAVSESKSGVNVKNSETRTEDSAALTTITGRKSMVTNADYASYYLTSVPDNEAGEPVRYVIPRDTKGLSFEGDLWNGLGMRGNYSCPMVMDHCEVPQENRIMRNREHDEFPYPVDSNGIYFMAGLAAVYTGLTKAIYDAALAHTQNRQFPDHSTLFDKETVKIHLSHIYENQLTSEALLRDALAAVEQHEEAGVTKLEAARLHASDSAIQSALLAMRLGGGYAYNQNGPLSRLLRDALAAQVMVPSVDVMRLNIPGK